MERLTSRLRLLALSVDELRCYLQDPTLLALQLGVRLSRDVLTERVQRAIAIKIERMQDVPQDLHPWYTYWLVIVQAESFGAGLIGFKGAPDVDGLVEIGYGIDPHVQRHGYMSEALRAMTEWAFLHEACHGITATRVLRTNLASQHVLENCGFRLTSEDEDNLDYLLQKGPGGAK